MIIEDEEEEESSISTRPRRNIPIRKSNLPATLISSNERKDTKKILPSRKVVPMTPMEMADQGFFLVKRILDHKYKQGWRFLTLWAPPYGVEDATWEPIQSFILDDGIYKVKVNEALQDYISEKKLDMVNIEVEKMIRKREESKEKKKDEKEG